MHCCGKRQGDGRPGRVVNGDQAAMAGARDLHVSFAWSVRGRLNALKSATIEGHEGTRHRQQDGLPPHAASKKDMSKGAPACEPGSGGACRSMRRRAASASGAFAVASRCGAPGGGRFAPSRVQAAQVSKVWASASSRMLWNRAEER